MEPRTETLKQQIAACDRALVRLGDKSLPGHPPNDDLAAYIHEVRASTVAQLAERIGQTNALFRDANDEIAVVAQQTGVDPMPLLCECAAIACTAIIRVHAYEYEELRANPRRFLNVPEHELESGTHARVVADLGAYVVIENVGLAAETAAALAKPHVPAAPQP